MCCYEWLWCSTSALRTQLIPLASSCISCCRHLLDIFGADPPAAFTNRFVYLQSWPCVCSGDYRQKCLPVCRSLHHKMVCGVIFLIILFVWNHFLWICSVLCRGRTRVSCESSCYIYSIPGVLQPASRKHTHLLCLLEEDTVCWPLTLTMEGEYEEENFPFRDQFHVILHCVLTEGECFSDRPWDCNKSHMTTNRNKGANREMNDNALLWKIYVGKN